MDELQHAELSSSGSSELLELNSSLLDAADDTIDQYLSIDPEDEAARRRELLEQQPATPPPRPGSQSAPPADGHGAPPHATVSPGSQSATPADGLMDHAPTALHSTLPLPYCSLTGAFTGGRFDH